MKLFNMFRLDEHGVRKPNERWTFAFRIMNGYNDESEVLMNIDFGRRYWWWKIPKIISPEKRWVDTSHYAWAKPGPDGRTGYYELIRKKYGFSMDDTSLHVYHGTQSDCWPGDKTKCFFWPWKELRCVRHTILNDGGIPQISCPLDERGETDIFELGGIRKKVKPFKFLFNDFDGEEIIASCLIEEREYRRGSRRFKWLGWITPKMVVKDLEIHFNKEVGRQKGSWKGGTVGHGIEMFPGETALDAFERYAENYGLSNVLVVEET